MNGIVWPIEITWKGRRSQMAERRKFTDYEKKTVYARGDGRCGICGRPVAFKNMTIDHIVPLSKGGTNDFENLQPACSLCNMVKSCLTMDELQQIAKHIIWNEKCKRVKGALRWINLM